MKHREFFEKVAKIFGAELDDLAYTEDIPHKLRAESLKKYYDTKSKEAPTSLLKALAVGGLTGAGLGGLTGALEGQKRIRLTSALIGAGVGGLLGAGVGGVMRWADKADIKHAKDFLKTNKGKKLSKALEREAASIYGGHKEARRHLDYHNEERRHRQLMGAIRGHDDSTYFPYYY